MLTDSFLDFIKVEKLFKKEDHLLLAISGGVDSVVLAHLLHQTGYQFSLAHMNFQLRGDDSNLDEAFVGNLAKELNVTCHIKRVDVAKGHAKQGNSTQMQARKLRYNWFAELMEQNNYSKLLTAHHAEDSFETALLNLSRGTGIKGLRGILPETNKIARPLLFTHKSDIISYAKKHKLQWREDISNQSDDYKRNDIRHNVIPYLTAQNPSLFEGFRLSSIRLRAAEDAYLEKIAALEQKYTSKGAGGLLINKQLLNLQFGIVYLSEILKPFDFTLQQLSSFSFHQSGALLEAKNHILSVDREYLILRNKNEVKSVFATLKFNDPKGEIRVKSGQISHVLRWELSERLSSEHSRSKNKAMIDFSLLKEPILLRTWKEGDKMKPLGMRGHKKVSDILIDEKVSVPDKEKQLVLESDGEIVWLLNRRISENFKITEQTSIVLRLEYHEIN